MDYVLLGNFQSDPLEKRFSWYRQLSGGNYFLSVRQVFQNEKKIKVVTILRYAGCTVKEMQEIASSAGKDTETSVGLWELTKDIESSLSETASRLDDADCQGFATCLAHWPGQNTVFENAIAADLCSLRKTGKTGNFPC